MSILHNNSQDRSSNRILLTDISAIESYDGKDTDRDKQIK
jgi:hypothetical protein